MARPTLLYYSFLNLAKVYMELRGQSVVSNIRHGIGHKNPTVTTPSWSTADLSVSNGVFREFVRALGQSQTQNTYQVGRLMQQVVGVHRVWEDVTNKSSRFALVDLTMERCIASPEVLLVARYKANPPATRNIAEVNAKRLDLHRTTIPEDDRTTKVLLRYEGTPEAVGRGRGKSHHDRVRKASQRLKPYVHTIIGDSDDVRFYLSDFGNDEKYRLPQLASIYALTFFLGSIARYRPYDLHRYYEKKAGWLLREFLATQPAQFVYLLASEMAGALIYIPMADIGPRDP